MAVPCGCALRGLLQGRVPAAPFWLIALIATLGLLEAWRLSYYQVSRLGLGLGLGLGLRLGLGQG